MFPAQVHREQAEVRRESPSPLRGERDEDESIKRKPTPMEMTTSGEASSGGGGSCKKKRPPSRLQKHAPATLRLEPPPSPSPAAGAWGDGRTTIPLLSPLVVSPAAAWEAVDLQAGLNPRRECGAQGGGGHPEARSCAAARAVDDAPCGGGGGGWRHPALTTPVAEPASLVPFFQSQCALEVHNAQQ